MCGVSFSVVAGFAGVCDRLVADVGSSFFPSSHTRPPTNLPDEALVHLPVFFDGAA